MRIIKESKNVSFKIHVWEWWLNLDSFYYLGKFLTFDFAIMFVIGYLSELPTPDDSVITIIDNSRIK